MALVKGPFTLKWGDTSLSDVDELSVDYSVDTEDAQTIQGQVRELAGPHKVTADVSLLASDIPALAALLPQYYVANGEVLSTGETVDHAEGAMDLVPGGCDTDPVYNNFDIIACGSDANIARIVNARTEFVGFEVDNKIRKAVVRIIGEAASDEATVQFFREGTVSVVS